MKSLPHNNKYRGLLQFLNTDWHSGLISNIEYVDSILFLQNNE